MQWVETEAATCPECGSFKITWDIAVDPNGTTFFDPVTQRWYHGNNDSEPASERIYCYACVQNGIDGWNKGCNWVEIIEVINPARARVIRGAYCES